MQAAATAQSKLLDVQSVDTAIAQLEHRRRSLPELALIAEKQQERRRQGEELIAANTAVSDLELELDKAESDLEPVRQRLERDQQRVDSGSVTDPKQLNALLDEIAHLKRRISDLEDVQLEVMERHEQATAVRDGITAARAAGEGELRALLAARDEQLGELDAELAQHRGVREAAAAQLPAELLDLYDRIRARSGGIGAAALVRRRCSGCQLEANSSDLARYRAAAADEVLRCEECNRILVRTADSGL
ncbi:zinc ribbon domain-containing protein [Micropruina sonneratiae]|uniref:zinc ribbon domain-containing protein n=1 Tax=Micropruina sonneratiae TaxID=2986940 RepID=UPI002226D771|nr:C4-type zinc ribbon domain-containing protein [Micropruina sp. KQZ13P-5]MCW3156769.1 C4-type zinc ribbon domain-containing protein [Micropruina sp. KQZ13P-5]